MFFQKHQYVKTDFCARGGFYKKNFRKDIIYSVFFLDLSLDSLYNKVQGVVLVLKRTQTIQLPYNAFLPFSPDASNPDDFILLK